MLFLEIEHPERDRVVLPLRDGIFVFPPAGLARSTCGCRLRITVKGDAVVLQPLGSEGHLRQGSRPRDRVELSPGQFAEVDATRLTVRSGSASLLVKRRGSPRLASVPQGPAAGARSSPRSARGNSRAGGGKSPRRFSFGDGSRRGRGVGRPPAGLARHHVAGRDRWTLMSLFAAGCVGRRDLARALIIRRNDVAAGTPRDIADILRKSRFLGDEFDAILHDVEARWCLACTSCRRVFEPEPPVLDTFRCLECDRRLSPRPRAAADETLDEPENLPSTYDRLPPGARLGDYKVEQLLGIGGYGAVYKSFDTRIQRRVALKVFPSDREEGDEVLREARNVAAFPPHPNLVLVYHVGQALGFDYISYEYVSGRSLAFHIERRTHLTLKESLRLLRDVLSGLATAHQHGVIHRDLKPDNILLVRVEGQFRARITDFGLGQRLRAGQGAYHSRTIRGAPEYLAPEQFRTQVSSAASDLYSVGATFFHLLTGQAPFSGASDHELAERHLEDPVPSLSEHLPSCPAYLEILFQKLLAKDPKDRPMSAEDALSLLSIAESVPVGEVPAVIGRSPPRSGWLAVGMLATSLCIVTLQGPFPWVLDGAPQDGEAVSALDRSADSTASLAGGSSPVHSVPPAPVPRQETGAAPPATGAPYAAGELLRLDSSTALVGEREVPLRIPALEHEGFEEVATSSTLPEESAAKQEEVEALSTTPEESPSASVAPPPEAAAPDSGPEGGGAQVSPEDEEPATAAPAVRGADPVVRPPERSFEEVLDRKRDGAAATEAPRASSQKPEPVALGGELAGRFTDPSQWNEDLAALSAWVRAHGASAAAKQAGALEQVRCILTLFEGQGILPRIADGTAMRCFLQQGVRETLEGDRSAEPRPEVAAKIYRADQVATWLTQLRVRVSRSGLENLIKVNLPSEAEARSSTLAQSGGTDLLEWIQDAEGEMVLFDHHTQAFRPESRKPGFSRLSTVRLHLCVMDFTALQRQVAQAAASLTNSH